MIAIDSPASWPAVRRAMTTKAAKRNPAIAVAAWNNAYSVGMTVEFRSHPHAVPKRFVTRSKAEVLSGHTPVLWLALKSGCVSLESLVPIESEEQRATRLVMGATVGVVYVCPSKDIECGARPELWCDICPKRGAA